MGDGIQGIRDKIVLCTKCGVRFTATGMEMDSRPETIRKSLEGSLRRLKTDYIDLYYQHRVDPQVEPEVVADTMAQLIKEGKFEPGASPPSAKSTCAGPTKCAPSPPCRTCTI